MDANYERDHFSLTLSVFEQENILDMSRAYCLNTFFYVTRSGKTVTIYLAREMGKSVVACKRKVLGSFKIFNISQNAYDVLIIV